MKIDCSPARVNKKLKRHILNKMLIKERKYYLKLHIFTRKFIAKTRESLLGEKRKSQRNFCKKNIVLSLN